MHRLAIPMYASKHTYKHTFDSPVSPFLSSPALLNRLDSLRIEFQPLEQRVDLAQQDLIVDGVGGELVTR